jgi:tRNA A-37 threonylcarbamoyl transferase component Bud32
MKEKKYTERELKEIEEWARILKRRNLLKLPCIIRGNKVASRNPDSRIRNYSTITGCFPLSTGKWVYLVYAYPLSIIHRLLDGLVKWATEKYCIKVLTPKKWSEAFTKNSFIPIIPVDISSVVAMPYIENENLFDILSGRVGNYTFPEKESIIKEAVRIINEMHAKDTVWGELIVQNIIRSQEGEIIICDTETVYYRGSLIEQKASDYLDFICSVCGSMSKLHPEKIDYLIQIILEQIQDDSVRQDLKERCRKKRTWLHRLFFIYTTVRLACPPKLYDRIKTNVWGQL